MPHVEPTTTESFLSFTRQSKAVEWITRAGTLSADECLVLMPGVDFPSGTQTKLWQAGLYGAAKKMGKVIHTRRAPGGGIRLSVDRGAS